VVRNVKSDRLFADVKNLVLSHKLFPVEAYEFPQESVAEFWKSAFEERGMRVFGTAEVPADMKVIQTTFILPDEPPEWLTEQDTDGSS